MSERIPVPQWLENEKRRLSETPIVLPVGVKPPTVEEVAMQQLKKAREPVQPLNPTIEEVAVQQLINQARKSIIQRIIEKVRSI